MSECVHHMISLTYKNATTAVETDNLGIVSDDTLRTAVLISLLTRRRVAADEAPDPTVRGGWWGDGKPDVDGDEIGSKLWLLSGSKVTADALSNAVQWSEEALAWMVEDGIASEVSAEAVRVDTDVLDIVITIEKPDIPADQWLEFWEAQLSEAS